MTSLATITEQKKQLRKTMRKRRRLLTKRQQQRASHSMAKNIPANLRYRGSASTAYCADDGEVDTNELFGVLRRARKNIYLPFIDPNGRMRFVRLPKSATTQKLVKGRWGIDHPDLRNARFAYPGQLSQVFVPLVAFDTRGKRLGRGGGFYDKLLSEVSGHCRSVGLAHDFQRVDQIPVETWDQPLDIVITDEDAYN